MSLYTRTCLIAATLGIYGMAAYAMWIVFPWYVLLGLTIGSIGIVAIPILAFYLKSKEPACSPGA